MGSLTSFVSTDNKAISTTDLISSVVMSSQQWFIAGQAAFIVEQSDIRIKLGSKDASLHITVSQRSNGDCCCKFHLKAWTRKARHTVKCHKLAQQVKIVTVVFHLYIIPRNVRVCLCGLGRSLVQGTFGVTESNQPFLSWMQHVIPAHTVGNLSSQQEKAELHTELLAEQNIRVWWGHTRCQGWVCVSSFFSRNGVFTYLTAQSTNNITLVSSTDQWASSLGVCFS